MRHTNRTKIDQAAYYFGSEIVGLHGLESMIPERILHGQERTDLAHQVYSDFFPEATPVQRRRFVRVFCRYYSLELVDLAARGLLYTPRSPYSRIEIEGYGERYPLDEDGGHQKWAHPYTLPEWLSLHNLYKY